MGANPQGPTMRSCANSAIIITAIVFISIIITTTTIIFTSSESDKDEQESVADGCAKRGTLGENPSTTADVVLQLPRVELFQHKSARDRLREYLYSSYLRLREIQ